jgi:hypothetical protein
LFAVQVFRANAGGIQIHDYDAHRTSFSSDTESTLNPASRQRLSQPIISSGDNNVQSSTFTMLQVL